MSLGQRYFCFVTLCCIAFDVLLIGGSFADMNKLPADTGEFTQNQQPPAVQSQMQAVETQPAKAAAVQDSYDDGGYKTEIAQYSDVILPYGCFDEKYLENTVFIGDSNTEGLSVYGFLPQSNVFGKRSMTVAQTLNTKFVTLDDGTVVTAIDGAKQYQPQRIIVNLGTNNTVGTKAEDFASQYSDVVDALQTACPDSEIIVAAVLPVGYYRENYRIKQQTIDSFNLALAQLCRSEGLSFLNYGEVFKGENGYMNKEYVASDGIHLNNMGYSLLLEYVNTHQLVTHRQM